MSRQYVNRYVSKVKVRLLPDANRVMLNDELNTIKPLSTEDYAILTISNEDHSLFENVRVIGGSLASGYTIERAQERTEALEWPMDSKVVLAATETSFDTQGGGGGGVLPEWEFVADKLVHTETNGNIFTVGWGFSEYAAKPEAANVDLGGVYGYKEQDGEHVVPYFDGYLLRTQFAVAEDAPAGIDWTGALEGILEDSFEGGGVFVVDPYTHGDGTAEYAIKIGETEHIVPTGIAGNGFWFESMGGAQGGERILIKKNNSGLATDAIVKGVKEIVSYGKYVESDKKLIRAESVKKVPNSIPDAIRVIDYDGAVCPELSTFDDMLQWDFSKIEKFGYFFNGSSFNQQLPAMPELVDASNMFNGAASYNQPLPSMPHVRKADGMFSGAKSFNQPLSTISELTSVKDMFAGAESFNHQVSHINMNSVSDSSGMFARAKAFNQTIPNLPSVVKVSSMLSGAESFNKSLSLLPANLSDISGLLGGAKAFNATLPRFTNLENAEDAFSGAESFNQNISNWTVARDANLGGMFNGAKRFNQDLSSWNVSESTMPTDFATGCPMPSWRYPKFKPYIPSGNYYDTCPFDKIYKDGELVVKCYTMYEFSAGIMALDTAQPDEPNWDSSCSFIHGDNTRAITNRLLQQNLIMGFAHRGA